MILGSLLKTQGPDYHNRMKVTALLNSNQQLSSRALVVIFITLLVSSVQSNLYLKLTWLSLNSITDFTSYYFYSSSCFSHSCPYWTSQTCLSKLLYHLLPSLWRPLYAANHWLDRKVCPLDSFGVPCTSSRFEFSVPPWLYLAYFICQLTQIQVIVRPASIFVTHLGFLIASLVI